MATDSVIRLAGVHVLYGRHLALGRDTLPVSFHQAIKALPVRKLIEHDYGLDVLAEEMVFIAGL